MLQVSTRRGVRLRGWVRQRGPRLLTAAALTWAVVWIATLFFAPDVLFGGRFIDAGTYYGAGLAFRHGSDLYGGVAFRQWPLVAALWSPLTLLSAPAAFRLWAVASMVGVATACVALRFRLRRESRKVPLLGPILLFLGPPTLIMLYLGQMSGICFAAYAVAVTLLPKHPRAAGACLAMIVAKPNLALIALPALIAAPPEAFVAFVLAALVWPIGSLLVSGPAPLVAFLLHVYAVRDSTLGLVSSSLGSLVPLEGTPHTIVQAALLAGLVGMVAWLWWRRRRGMAVLTDGDVDLVAVVTLAALPYALVSDLLFVLPLLLRCFLLPGRTASMLLTVWWLVPWLAALLAHAGGGGIAALLPLVALVGYYRLFRRQRFQIADHRAGDLGLGRSAGGDADLMGAT
jgi:hypothetical protein